MKKLSQRIKQALAALAAADAGEMLTPQQMDGYLIDRPDLVPESAPPPRQVALWMGDAHHAEAMAYALSACRRLQAGLTVLLPGAPLPPAEQSRIRQGLANTGLTWRQINLDGAPKAALPEYIASHPQVIFLVVSAVDPSVLDLAQRQNLGIPLVMVASDPKTTETPPELAVMAI